MKAKTETIPYIPAELAGEIGSFSTRKMQRRLRLVSNTWNKGVSTRHTFCDEMPRGRIGALAEGDIKRLDYFQRNGANIAASHVTFLWACEDGRLKVVKWFLQRGADFNPSKGAIPLELASANGCLPLVKLLVRRGAWVREYRDGPFKAACANGHLDVAKWLVKMGADIRSADRAGGTREVDEWRRQNGVPIITYPKFGLDDAFWGFWLMFMFFFLGSLWCFFGFLGFFGV